jgi:hypothetical protein
MLASRLGASYPADHVQSSTLALWAGALSKLPYDHAERVVEKATDVYPNRAPTLGHVDVLIEEQRIYMREEAQAALPEPSPLTTRDRLRCALSARAAMWEFRRFIKAGDTKPRPHAEILAFITQTVDAAIMEFDDSGGIMTEAEADKLMDDAIFAFAGSL